MIKVVYNREKNRITVEGHAYSGEAGHDLICASASILIYTIALTVERMKEAGLVKDALIDIKAGDSVVSYEPIGAHSLIINTVLDSICAGYELLAANYPENISYEIKE